ELRTIYQELLAIAVPENALVIDLGLTRGSLEYYTGTLCEVFSHCIPEERAALAGGGRYDGLLHKYLKQVEAVPAVGASIGIERVEFALKRCGKSSGVARQRGVLLVSANESGIPTVMKIGRHIRSSGDRVSIYPGATAFEKAMAYAKSNGFERIAI